MKHTSAINDYNDDNWEVDDLVLDLHSRKKDNSEIKLAVKEWFGCSLSDYQIDQIVRRG